MHVYITDCAVQDGDYGEFEPHRIQTDQLIDKNVSVDCVHEANRCATCGAYPSTGGRGAYGRNRQVNSHSFYTWRTLKNNLPVTFVDISAMRADFCIKF